MSDRPRPPMDPETDEADSRQLDLARAQGQAYLAAAQHMIDEVAQTGGTQRAGDLIIGFAVEEAEGMYDLVDDELQWHDPEDANAHIEVTVMDAADHRFVPGLEVTVTVVEQDGEELGAHQHPMLWHPMLWHYGRNWQLPGDGRYSLRVDVAAATFPRHDDVNGRRFSEPQSVEFFNVEIATGQD